MAALEAEGLLQREVEFLPSSEEMADRRRSGRGLERPELAVLLAYAKRSLTGALLRVARCPTTPTSRATCARYFPPAVVERLGHLLGRASAAPRARGDDRLQPRRQRARARPSSRGSSPSRAPSRPTSCAPTASPATSPAPSARWAAIEQLSAASIARRSGSCMEGVDELVEAHGALVPRERPRGRPGHGDRHRARGLRAAAGARCRKLGTKPGARRAQRAAAALVEQGVPEELAHAHAYLPALGHAPDVIAAARPSGAPSRTSARPSRCWRTARDRLDRGAARRAAREHAHAALGAAGAARRPLARPARPRAAGAEDVARRAGARRRRGASSRRAPTRCAASPASRARMAGEGGADLAGLTLAVRQLRALAS